MSTTIVEGMEAVRAHRELVKIADQTRCLPLTTRTHLLKMFIEDLSDAGAMDVIDGGLSPQQVTAAAILEAVSDYLKTRILILDDDDACAKVAQTVTEGVA